VLLDGLGVSVNVKFVLYQFPRNSRHVSRLPCEDVPIFLEEFDEGEFLFGIQTIPHMCNLAGLTRGQWNRLIELVLRLVGQLGSLVLGHNWDCGWGGAPRMLSSNVGVLQTTIACQLSSSSLDRC
jgi:hypothetical protein